MPVPAPPEDQPTPLSAVLALFRQLHEELRQELSEIDDTGLNWVPVEGANSMAVIVIHLLGSEAESLGVLAGQRVSRDRDAEFDSNPTSQSELLRMLEDADRSIGVLGSQLGDRLDEWLPLPSLPEDQRRPGITWLIGSYGHGREHLGQIQLTRQLYLAQRAEGTAPG